MTSLNKKTAVAHAFNESGESDEEESVLEQIVEHARIVGT